MNLTEDRQKFALGTQAITSRGFIAAVEAVRLALLGELEEKFGIKHLLIPTKAFSATLEGCRFFSYCHASGKALELLDQPNALIDANLDVQHQVEIKLDFLGYSISASATVYDRLPLDYQGLLMDIGSIHQQVVTFNTISCGG